MNSTAIWFDGPEKKLDIFLLPPRPDLSDCPDSLWEHIVNASNARIVSKITSGKTVAYILSESSLFIWPTRILMMTCGNSNPIRALPELLGVLNKKSIARFCYERKTFSLSTQQSPAFEEDVNRLHNFFPGHHRRLGSATDDRVDLYYAFPDYSSPARKPVEPEATLQLLMHDMDPTLIDIFSSKKDASGELAAKLSGLDAIYPRMLTDSHLFVPCGFSMNGIRDNDYFSIHVTPQPEGSYASFETSVIDNDYPGKIERMVSIFKPEKFSVVLRTSLDNGCLPLHLTVKVDLQGYCETGYRRYELDPGYRVTFLNYQTDSRRRNDEF